MTPIYKRYALILMTTVYGVNLTERALVGLLIEPIRVDLHLSDTQIGLVTGIAFGLFYTLGGLALSRWADRGDRSLIAAVSIGLWGVVMMSFTLVGSFVQLMLARLAVAIGEAGCKPPTYSLIGDYFPQSAERTRAMSIWWLSSPLAALLGYMAGGWLNEHFGWRMTFFIMGVPGLLLAVLVWFTLKEPRREVRLKAISPLPTSTLWSAFLAIWRQPTARQLMFAMILFYTLAHGMVPWKAAFLIRIHGFSTGQLGTLLGLVMAGAGIFGVLLGGFVGARLANNERRQLWVTAIVTASLMPLFAAFLFVGDKYLALVLLFVSATGLFFFLAPTFALFQRLVPENVRATTLAIVMTAVHLISMGLGPQVVGVVSDLLKPTFANDSLRYGMLILSLVAIPSSYYFWKAGHSVTRDLDEIERIADRLPDGSTVSLGHRER